MRGHGPFGDHGPGGVRGAGRARSFTAIAEWAADADMETLRVLGAGGVLPSAVTGRRAGALLAFTSPLAIPAVARHTLSPGA